MKDDHQLLPGTIVWIAPFYNRSGYGVGARAFVLALSKVGIKIRIIAASGVEQGIDDCDMSLLRSLEKTPLVPPITAIFTHVPSPNWLNLQIPEPNLRIMMTTFDGVEQGNLPPVKWIEICKKMDQVWLSNDKERNAFITAGLEPEKIQIVSWPHHWLENPMLPATFSDTTESKRPFRFLSIAMFQPRRRWDTLIESFLLEFKDDDNVELCLKVNYPSWHPVKGKPQQDFYELIESLQQKTRSSARIIIDEELCTRSDIVRLIDSCNVYISTDTAVTAPIFEAWVRKRMVVIPNGLGISVPDEYYIGIAVDNNAKMPVTQEMLCYQPHHEGTFMPQLFVKDVRTAIRRAYAMPDNQRHYMADRAESVILGPTEAVPRIIDAIKAGWQLKKEPRSAKMLNVVRNGVIWEGAQFTCHSLALINRELCSKLIDAGYDLSILLNEKNSTDPKADSRFHKLSAQLDVKLKAPAQIHVRHQWPPRFSAPAEGHWVMIQPWEYGSLPVSWIAPMRETVDEIWVPSVFVRACYIHSGIPAEKVHVIPNGVDIIKFHPNAEPMPLRSGKRFKFLFVGGTIYRKGIDILLQAYFNTFTDRDDVCLVIKDMGGGSFYSGQNAGQMIAEMQKRDHCPEIEYLDRTMDEGEMAGLYTACDCLAHPYRGEGFGLPIAEAMACGLPVIVTNYGAATDFCRSSHAYLICAKEKQMPEKRVGNLDTIDYPWLAEPNRSDLARWMRHIYENREDAREKGRAGRRFVERHLTWDHAFKKVRERIEVLKGLPIRRFCNKPALSLEQLVAPGGNALGQSAEPWTNGLDAARELWQKDRVSEASALFQELIGKYSTEAVIYFTFTDMLIDTKQFKAALELLHRIPKTGDVPRKLELLAYCSVAAQQYDAAKTYIARIQGQKTGTAFLANLEGKMAFLAGDSKRAETYFLQAMETDAGHAEARVNLGLLKWAGGQKQTAFELFEKGFAMEPLASEIAHRYHTAAIRLGRQEQAEPFFKQMSEKHQNSKRLKCLYIDILLHQEKYNLAMALIADAGETFGPDDALAAAFRAAKAKNSLKAVF